MFWTPVNPAVLWEISPTIGNLRETGRPFPCLSMLSLMASWVGNWRLGRWKMWKKSVWGFPREKAGWFQWSLNMIFDICDPTTRCIYPNIFICYLAKLWVVIVPYTQRAPWNLVVFSCHLTHWKCSTFSPAKTPFCLEHVAGFWFSKSL